MRRLPPLNAIRFFEAAARHVSFVRAAHELNVTHGAVSRQIALLEDWLGVPLFRRTARQVLLTDAGRTLLRESGAALDRLELAAATVRQSGSERILAVSATPTFSMHWLIPRLSRFSKQCPDIEIRLTSSLEPVDFSLERYDVAIRRVASRGGEKSVDLFPAMLTPICSPDFMSKGKLKAEMLGKQCLIHTATSPSSWPNWLESVGQKSLQPAHSLYFDQLYFGVQACMNRMGFIIAPAVVVIDDIEAGRLSVPFPKQPLPDSTSYHAVASGSSESAEPTGRFLAWLQEEGAKSFELTQQRFNL